MLSSDIKTKSISRESRIFGQKAARSIIEIQHNVNNLADVVVFLEVLGYNRQIAMQNGFDNLYDLAKYVHDLIDGYDRPGPQNADILNSHTTPIPSTRHLISEGIGMIFPWLGSLILLFASGMSLWMAWGLPAQITTAFVVGVFLGLGITEGFLQSFNRLFTFYYAQKNIGEVRRLLKRNYRIIAAVLAATVVILYLVGLLTQIPYDLLTITSVSAVTVSLHRISYMPIYALKKLTHLIVGYSCAFVTLLVVYNYFSNLIADMTLRYFVALAIAFAVLSIFAIYNHYKITSTKSKVVTDQMPHFFKPVGINDQTIKSRLHIQLWETFPHFLFGIFYLAMIFSDRIISWIFNPQIINYNGIVLPLAFNSVYHAGADLALLVLLPAGILQYVIMGPVFIQLNIMSILMKVSDMNKINQFFFNKYKRILAFSLLSSGIVACFLYFYGAQILSNFGGSDVSMHILRIASVSNVLLSIFAANSMFMMLLNKTKILAILSILGTGTVVGYGITLAQQSFEGVVFAYLLSMLITAIVSTIYVVKTMKNAGSILFARYV